MAPMPTESKKTPPRRGVFPARVVTNRQLCDEHFLLRLDVGERFPASYAGQFVQIQCGRPDDSTAAVVQEWGDGVRPNFVRPELVESQPLLRRPFSLGGREEIDGRSVLEIIHRVVGRGSAWLSRLEPGETISVLGPLGNAFTWTAAMTTGLLVGGGVGTPPMMYLAKALQQAGKRAQAFVGATTRRLLPFNIDDGATPSKAGWPSGCVAEFSRYGADATVTTDDGSLGFEGRVTEALFNWIDQGRVKIAETIVYTCGPEPMMKAVAEGCIARGIACQVAMERKMACGMGTCQSCVCKTKADTPDGWRYQLVCTDGTVFDARDLIWNG